MTRNAEGTESVTATVRDLGADYYWPSERWCVTIEGPADTKYIRGFRTAARALLFAEGATIGGQLQIQIQCAARDEAEVAS